MWEFRDDRLWMTPPLVEDQDDPDLMVDLCERVETVCKRVDLLSGKETLDVKLCLPYDDKPIELRRGEVLQTKVLPKLIDQGLTIMDGKESATAISMVLLETEASAPVEYHHDKLGFWQVRGFSCFLGHHPFGALPQSLLASTYIHPQVTAPTGSKKTWRKFLLNECVTTPSLALVLALSISAPVAHLLKEVGVMPEVPLFALIGESSKGKTTLLSLCAAVWANPAHLIHNFHATNSAFFAMLNGQRGIPFLADEATYVPDFDFDDILYSLPTGKEKRRCTSSGELKPAVNFSGSIIMTSEVSILERTQGYGGQEARILEFSLEWTKSDRQAEKIREICYRNYAWGTEAVMNLLLGEGFIKKLIRRYHVEYRSLKANLARNANGIENRLLQRMALIMVSGWVAQKAFKVHLHLDAVESLLWDTFHTATHRELPADSAEAFLDMISSEIAQNQNRFPEENLATKKGMNSSCEGLWGVQSYAGNCRCVWILADVFQRIARKRPGIGFRTFCRKLEVAGFLARTRSDGYLKRHPLGSVEAMCYCVLFPETKTVVQRINALKPGKRTKSVISKALNRDPYGINTTPMTEMYQHNGVDVRMAIGFVSLSAQRMEMVLNKALFTTLKIKSKDKITILPLVDKGLLLVSKRRLCNDIPAVNVRLTRGGICADDPAIRVITEVCKMKINLYQRLVFGDISIEDGDESDPVAVINFENYNDIWNGTLCHENPDAIDDLMCTEEGALRKRYPEILERLLDDTEEDEDS